MKVYYQPGRYVCAVESQQITSSKSGRPMLVLGVEVLREVLADASEIDMNRYQRTVRLVFVEENQESLDYAMAKLRHAGFTGTSIEEDLDLEGQEIECVCEHGEFDGKPTEEWGLALPLRERDTTSDPAAARKIDAILGRRLTSGAAPAAPSAPSATTTAAEDDIPF